MKANLLLIGRPSADGNQLVRRTYIASNGDKRHFDKSVDQKELSRLIDVSDKVTADYEELLK